MLAKHFPPLSSPAALLHSPAAAAAPTAPNALIKAPQARARRLQRLKQTSTSQRGVLPATLAEALAAYSSAHPDQDPKDVRRALGAFVEAIAPEHAGADRVITAMVRSVQPKSEKLQRILASIPTEVLVDGDLAVLLAPDRVAERLKISVKTARSYKSRLKRVRQWLRKGSRGRLHLLGHLETPAWRQLAEQAEARTGRKGAGNRVGRLGRFCEVQRLTPAQLQPAHTRAYWEWLATESGLVHYRNPYYGVSQDWRALAEVGAVAPVLFYKKSQDQQSYILSPEDVPPTLRAGFDTFAHQATAPGLSARPTRHPLSAGTLNNYRLAYYGLLGAVAQSGVDLSGLTVSDLFLEPSHMEVYCQRLWQEAKGQWRRWHKGRLDQLHRMGVFLVAQYDPAADLESLDWIRAQIARMIGTRPVRPLPVISPEAVERMIGAIQQEIVARQARGAHPSSLLVVRRDLFIVLFLRDRASRVGDLEHMHLVEGAPPEPSALVDDPIHGYLSTTAPFAYRVRTKPGTIDRAQVPIEARAAWLDYLALRQQLGFDSPWLLVSDEGDHLCPGMVTLRIAHWAKRAGFHMTAQDFRRVFVTEELDDHGDEELVKALRASSSTEVIRDHYDTHDCRQASQRWNDLIEAHLDNQPQALPLVIQRVLARAADEESIRQGLQQAMDQMDAEREAIV